MTPGKVGQVSKPAAGFQPASEDFPIYALTRIRLLLRSWSYYKYLESVTLAGSHAKGTALRDSDLDLFLSLAPGTPGPLAAIQTSLWNGLQPVYQPVIRNVSVRIILDGASIDLVPARNNILWQARFNTWLKTD
jgi:tRNA nucleotidyltransferase (CCA-adding enzyme)